MSRSGRPKWMIVEDMKQLQRQKRLDSLESERMKMDKKAEHHNIQRRLQAERMEEEMELQLTKEKEKAARIAAQRQEAERMAEEMKHLDQESLREIKLRQQLRESSEELKCLEARLRAAYVSKELAAQIAEKRAAAKQEKVEQKKLRGIWEVERRCMEEEEEKQVKQALENRLTYRIELQDQIISAYKKQQEAYQDFLKEKALLDQIVKAIHEEDQREEEAKMERMMRTKRDIAEFQTQQEIWKQRELIALEEEDRRIKMYLEQREKEEKKKFEESKEKEEIKKRLQEQLQASLLSQQARDKEREQVLAELAAEELRERDIQRAREEMETAIRKREQLQHSYREQLRERRRHLQEEEQQEELFKKQLMAQFAEDSRLEQLTAEKRRLKILEHRRQVQHLLEEKHKQRVKEWEQLAVLEKQREAEEKHRKQLIEEERLKMLKKHATKLLGYLPRGVLREDDFTHLGSDFLDEFKKYQHLNEPENYL